MSQSEGGAGRHTLTYHIRNSRRADTRREIDVHATPEELERFRTDGYLVREKLFGAEQVERLRTALGEVMEREHPGGLDGLAEWQRRDGVYMRHLMDKHPTFLELFRFEPTLSVARAVLGPQVQVQPLTSRISFPDEAHRGTTWHFHQRVIPDPIPPFFTRPHVLDCLIYLDDVTDENGPLSVVPGTHLRIEEDLVDDYSEGLPGAVTLRPSAGSCVMIHGATWHRAHPTTPRWDGIRRLLILPYSASWLKLPSYGVRPADGLLNTLREGADAETKELLGEAEGLY
jgi:ectoine hydroxylase-related dioxygenase (phytanoyl-CoA dioxygenase family)